MQLQIYGAAASVIATGLPLAGNLIEKLIAPVVYSLIFTLLGIVVFAVAFFAMTKMVPFSIRKEIEEDQNTALGIVIGSVILGLALIISAAIKGE